MKKITKIALVGIIALLFALSLALIACDNGVTATQLATPTNLQVQGTTLSWNAVPNADSYSIQVNSETPITGISATSHQLSALVTVGEYSIRVRAIGNGTTYTDSEWSSAIIHTVAKTTATVAQPTFNGTLTFGDALPTITTTTTGGTIALDEGQILLAGTRNYNWTFTPANTTNYEWSNLTGTISLTVNKATITVAQPTFSGTLTFGDALPTITTTTTGGTLVLDAGQTLTAGTANYNWTFTPNDADNFEIATGTISLTVAKRTVSVVQPTFIGTLTFGDALPTIATITTGGTISLNAGQTLLAGTRNE